MTQMLRRAMDALYWACVLIAGTSMVAISIIVPWGVFTRYVLNSASSWPEPAAILLSIVLTFFGAAAGYRVRLHMRVTFARDRLPPIPLGGLCLLLFVLEHLEIGAPPDVLADEHETAVPVE